jgi:parallel beta-helix repeat protein
MFDRDASLIASNIRAVSVLESTVVGPASFQSIDILTVERNTLSTVANSFVLSTYYINVAAIRDNTVTGSDSASQQDLLYVFETGISSATPALLALDISGNAVLNGGINFYCYSCRHNMTISSNTVDGSRTAGIKIDSGGRLTLLNNTIKNFTTSASAFDIASNMHGYGGSVDCRGNRVVRSVSTDAMLTLNCGTRDCTFENNVVQDCAAATLVSFGGFPWAFQRNLFVNSTAEVSVSIAPASPLTMKDTIALPANHWGLLQADVSGPRVTVLDAFARSAGPIVSFETVLTGPSTSSSLQTVAVPGGLLPDGSVGGLLDGNRTVQLAPGNYTCRLSFILRDSAKLVLSGDVGIAFASSRGLVLLGDAKLITVGGAPRLFNASVSHWKGITVDANATTALSNLHVQMATVAIDHKGAGGLSLHGVNVETTSGRCIVSDPGGGVVTGSFLISGGSVRDCGNDAIFINLRASAAVLNTSISQAVGFGIQAGYTSNLTVKACTIERTSSQGLYAYQSSSNIADNAFTYCSVYVLCDNSCELLVERNRIAGSMSSMSFASPLYIRSWSSKNAVVQDNVIEAWDVSDTLAALDVTFSAGGDPSVGLDVSRNMFRNISAGSILAINYVSTKRATNVGNIFQRNLAATSTTYPALIVVHAWPSDSGGVLPTMRGNIFHEELLSGAAQYYIQIRSEASEVERIDASRSYWSNASEAALVDRISAGNDDSRYSMLQYLPVLLTKDPGGPVGPNTSSLGFIQPGGLLSGILGENENVTLERGNYSAVGTLTVDGRLTILPGAQIRMDPDVSLVVRSGSLVVTGSSNEPVLFVSALAGSNWGQIRVLPNVTGQQELLLSNVVISGAGSGSLPAIYTRRASALMNVSIEDCIGGGVLVDEGFNKLSMNNVHSVDVTSYVGSMSFNVRIAGSGVATLKNVFLSSTASVELYLEGYNSVELIAENLEIYPKAASHYGILSRSKSSIRNLTFDASRSDTGFGYAIYADFGSFELVSSRILVGRYGRGVHAYSLSSCSFAGNRWSGHSSSVNFFHSYGGSSVSFYNNTFERSGCSEACLVFNGAKVEVLENLVIDVAVSNSLLRLDATEPSIIRNRFERISGYAGLEVASGPPAINFSRNAWVNVSSLAFLVTTSTTYEGVQGGGIYSFPGNFWDTTSFETLQAKTLDAQDDPRLADVLYSAIFVDPDMIALLGAPATSPCLDTISKTIACVIRDDTTVVVPAGLYYAPRSITLRHANAILVFQAGVRVMFAEGASIRIDEGTFVVRGTDASPVIMTSTSRLLDEFGVAYVQNSTRWGGVRFGPNSNPSVIQSDEYVSGSALEGCVIQDAGYSYLNSPAALYLEQVSVLLDRVSVLDSGSGGIYMYYSRTAVLLKDSIISGSAGYGLFLNAPTSEVTLQKVTVQASQSIGVYASYHQNLSISDCRFSANYAYQFLSYAAGTLRVTKRCVLA